MAAHYLLLMLLAVTFRTTYVLATPLHREFIFMEIFLELLKISFEDENWNYRSSYMDWIMCNWVGREIYKTALHYTAKKAKANVERKWMKIRGRLQTENKTQAYLHTKYE
jgi:hypothetical protein